MAYFQKAAETAVRSFNARYQALIYRPSYVLAGPQGPREGCLRLSEG